MKPPLRLDAHQHFWRYDPIQYPWIPRGSALQRNWFPPDLEAVQEPLGLDGSIAVQAQQVLAESEWLLALAENDPRIKGVVGWVDLQNDRVDDDLVRLARHPKFVGVRHVVQDEPDDNFLLRPAFVGGLERLRAHDLTYDLLVFPRQLTAAIEVVRRFPDQPFVLDHIAKPLIKSGEIEPWRAQIRELAQSTNVMCKVSGLVTEADHAAWQSADFRPYLDVVFEAFGEDRLMFGSDWPVCLLAGSYERVFRLAEQYTTALSPSARQKIFGINAITFYGV